MARFPALAIVGMSLQCPGANSLGAFWRNLAGGVDSITEVPPRIIEPFYFDPSRPEGVDRFYCHRGGFTQRLIIDPIRFGVLPVAVDGSDPDQLLALTLVQQALDDAGIPDKGISLRDAVVIIGRGGFAGLPQFRVGEVVRVAAELTTVIGHAVPELTPEQLTRIRTSYQQRFGRYAGDTVTAAIPSLAASIVANHFDIHGPAYTVDAACASGIVALQQSARLLASGEADIAIVGAMHSAQSSAYWSAFTMMGALSRSNQISPFSQDADGLLIGQGAGFLIVKTLERAIEDDDRIYAVVQGTAVGSDGTGHSVLITDTDAQTRVVRQAWQDAGCDPADVAYIEAHGTATPVGDASEIAALTTVFGDNTCRPAYLGSVKSNIGHLLPAAGMMGLIKTALALHHRQIPPTLHCQTPMRAVGASRFEPVYALTDWDESGLPLLAGVDAFGFGGINAHAVMTAYEPEPAQHARYRADRRRLACVEAFAVAAPTREALLAKIDLDNLKGHIGSLVGSPDDPCRLVVFDPTEARLALAVRIVQHGRPWLGRNDIWYTEQPLLAAGGKTAFVFPGWDPTSGCEHDSLVDELGLTWTDAVEYPGRPRNTAAQDHFHTSMLVHQALLKTGIKADLYTGHSIGEWHAARACGMLGEDFDEAIFSLDLDPERLWDPDLMPEFALIGALGDLDDEAIAQLRRDIPGLYLADDNSTHQKVFCAPGTSGQALMDALRARRVVTQLLPFSTTMHTPYFEAIATIPRRAMASVVVREGWAPLWSGVTLGQVQAAGASAADVFAPLLTNEIRFTQLLHLLYDQGVRVFIQAGVGALTGLVDDTLGGRDAASIAAISPQRSAVDQLRRVHALMFVEGGDADLAFMGVTELNRNARSVFLLPDASPILTDLPALDEALAPILAARTAPVAPPVAAAFGRAGTPPRGFTRAGAMPPAAPAPQASVPQASVPNRAGTRFEVPLDLSLDEHPYVIDHSLCAQPPGWPHPDDLSPVLPLAMSMELMGELAAAQVPGAHVVRLGPMTAMSFISIGTPFHSVVKGFWKSQDTVSLTIPGHLMIDVTLGYDYPEPPREFIDSAIAAIGPSVAPVLTREEQYHMYSFHGPSYWSCVRPELYAEHGFRMLAEKAPGKGSLIDQMGQCIGLFLHLFAQDNRVSFPVRVSDVTFYQDMEDQSGTFDCFCVIRSITDSFIQGDMVYLRDGAPWAIIRGWVNQRLHMPLSLWESVIHPDAAMLAQQVAPGVFVFRDTLTNAHSQVFVSMRYLNRADRDRRDTPHTAQARLDYIAGRVALRDAARFVLQRRDNGAFLYPIEVSIAYDQAGKPLLRRDDGSPFPGVLEASLTHKDAIGAAIVSEQGPVGIDLERIAARDDSAWALAFTDAERTLLDDLGGDHDTWATRFWVAKEAYAKFAGTGLSGAPRQFVVERVEPASDAVVLVIAGVRIRTIALDDVHILGWTVRD